MRIEYLDGKIQSDYDNGCIQIVAMEPKECFSLGMIFQRLIDLNYDVIKGPNSNPGYMIRIPLRYDTDDIKDF